MPKKQPTLNEILTEFNKAEMKLSTHPSQGGCSIQYAKSLQKVYSQEFIEKIRLCLKNNL